MGEELSDFGDFREGKSLGVKSGPDVQRAGGVGAVGVGGWGRSGGGGAGVGGGALRLKRFIFLVRDFQTFKISIMAFVMT